MRAMALQSSHLIGLGPRLPLEMHRVRESQAVATLSRVWRLYLTSATLGMLLALHSEADSLVALNAQPASSDGPINMC